MADAPSLAGLHRQPRCWCHRAGVAAAGVAAQLAAVSAGHHRSTIPPSLTVTVNAVYLLGKAQPAQCMAL